MRQSALIQRVIPNDWLTTDLYDDNGNTLGPQLSGAATDTYDWKNRLIRRTTAEGRIIDITYNATGDRVTKSTGISTVHYLVDRNNLTGYAQVVEELDSSLTVERAYIYGLDLIAQSQLMPPEDPAEWQISYYLYDGLGTVRGLADATGLVTDAYFYDAYGVLLNVIGVTPNTYLYTGEQYDPDLGLYFLRARYLNPNTGRFHTMDTFEGVRTDPQSLHKYLYAHANPVMGIDPSGLFTMTEIQWAVTITGVVSAVTSGLITYLIKPDAKFSEIVFGAFVGALGGTLSAATGNPFLAGALAGFTGGFLGSLFFEDATFDDAFKNGVTQGTLGFFFGFFSRFVGASPKNYSPPIQFSLSAPFVETFFGGMEQSLKQALAANGWNIGRGFAIGIVMKFPPIIVNGVRTIIDELQNTQPGRRNRELEEYINP